VGVDAAVKVKNTRCVAAGYPWNPYFTQLADPLNVNIIDSLEYIFQLNQDNNFLI